MASFIYTICLKINFELYFLQHTLYIHDYYLPSIKQIYTNEYKYFLLKYQNYLFGLNDFYEWGEPTNFKPVIH